MACTFLNTARAASFALERDHGNRVFLGHNADSWPACGWFIDGSGVHVMQQITAHPSTARGELAEPGAGDWPLFHEQFIGVFMPPIHTCQTRIIAQAVAQIPTAAA